MFSKILKHPKKTVFFSALFSYGVYYGNKKYNENILRREYCNNAKQLGDRLIHPLKELTRITVIHNPIANNRKSVDLFNKNIYPLLNLSGYKVNVIETERAEEAKEIMSVLKPEDQECLFVAGGDGTLLEVATGLLRRADLRNMIHKVPIVIAPLGAMNSFVNKLYGVQNDHPIRMCSDSVCLIEKNDIKPSSAIYIRPIPKLKSDCESDDDQSETDSLSQSTKEVVGQSAKELVGQSATESICQSEAESACKSAIEPPCNSVIESGDQLKPESIDQLQPESTTETEGSKQKEIYAMSGLDWSIDREVLKNGKRKWYFGPIRYHVQYTVSGIQQKHLTGNKTATLLYESKCYGCNTCAQSILNSNYESRPSDGVVRSIGRFLLPMQFKDSLARERQQRLAFEQHSRITNPNCGTQRKRRFVDVRAISVVLDDDQLIVKVRHREPSMFRYITTGLQQRFDPPYNAEATCDEEFRCVSLQIHPDNTSESDKFYIDNEEMDVLPVEMRVVEDALYFYQ